MTTKTQTVPTPKTLFVAGISAAIAEFITFPIDTTKVYLQLQYKISGNDPHIPAELEVGSANYGLKSGHSHPSFQRRIHLLRNGHSYSNSIAEIWNNHGIRGFYRGYKPAMLRASLNNALSASLYKPVRHLFGAHSRDCPLYIKLIAGFSTGATTQILAAPTDLLKVRMQADSVKTHPKYHGFGHAINSIYHKHGIKVFWRGLLPSMLRAGFSVAATLGTYDHLKSVLLSEKYNSSMFFHEESPKLHIICSLVSSFIAALLACPFDVVKTRYQAQSLYKSPVDCLQSITKNEGVSVLFRGFVPMYARLSPWQLSFFLVFELLNVRILGQSF